LNSGNKGFARLGGEVAFSLGVFKEEVAVLVALVRRNCCAVGAAVRRAVDLPAKQQLIGRGLAC